MIGFVKEFDNNSINNQHVYFVLPFVYFGKEYQKS